jgi:signal transduction histidine kinase/ActR/RegA family two-component response regulator
VRLRGKILTIVLSTTAAALLLAGAALMLAELLRLRRELLADLRTTAAIVADQSTAALAFQDPVAAFENLRALRAKRHLAMGCLYDASGELFADYRRTDGGAAPCPIRPAAESGVVGETTAELWAPVLLDGTRMGSLYLRSDLTWITARLRVHFLALLLSLGVALLGAVGLSLSLLRIVSRPIGELARVATEVTSRGSYGLRARRGTDDEVGELVDAFNAMLAAIEERNRALREAKEDAETANAGLTAEVAERQRAEQQKAELLEREQEARREAEAANRLRDEFLATISHELRTPLSAIVGWVSILKAGKRDEATLERAIDVIDRNTRAQTQLIGDLLDVSGVVTGKVQLDVADVEVAPIVAAVVDSLRPATESRGIRITQEIETLPPFRADPARLQQIVWNLLSNAVKFSGEGSRVAVRGWLADDGSVVLEVEDEGIGIHEDFLPHVFERFRQQDSSTTRAHGGLGLGLAIVRHLVELHGGTAEAESAGPGKGALFRVRIPFVPTAATSPTVARAAGYGRLRDVSILLVEDEADTRELYRLALAEQGARIRTAGTAEQAMETLRQGRVPDLLVSDIGLPGRDGYDLLADVRSLPKEAGGETPAIALTAYVGEGHARRALEAGFLQHLAKPIQPDELIEAVRRALGRPL